MPKSKPTNASIAVDPTASTLVFGGSITFTYALPTLPAGALPDARAVIRQGGDVVQNDFVSAHGGFPGPIALGPTPSWSGGAASGILELGYHTPDIAWKVVATSATFTVAA